MLEPQICKPAYREINSINNGMVNYESTKVSFKQTLKSDKKSIFYFKMSKQINHEHKYDVFQKY